MKCLKERLPDKMAASFFLLFPQDIPTLEFAVKNKLCRFVC